MPVAVGKVVCHSGVGARVALRESETSHKRVRAGVAHSLSRLKCWKFLRDYRRAAATLHDTASGIAYLHNIALGH
jgi:hypothetical protein